MPAAFGSPRSIAAAASEYLAYQRGSRRQIAQRRRVQVFHGGVVITGGERDLGQQQAAPGGGKPVGQFGGRAQVAERQAEQCLQLVRSCQQHGFRPGQDEARRVDRGQRLGDLPAGRPDPGPVEQGEELKDGPESFRYRQRTLGKLLRPCRDPAAPARCPPERAGSSRQRDAAGIPAAVASASAALAASAASARRPASNHASACAPRTSTSLAGSVTEGIACATAASRSTASKSSSHV